MSYCTASDVATLNRARVLGAGNNPTASDVGVYIDMIGGEIDAVLSTKGYVVPVNVASYPEAGSLLRMVNAKGAHWMMEEASPNSPNLDRVKAAYDAALKMLSDAKFSFTADADEDRGKVRAPFVAMTPSEDVYDPALQDLGGFSGDGISSGGTNCRRLPMISRSLRF